MSITCSTTAAAERDSPKASPIYKVTGQRVLVRCDFNVPIKNGVITDETRIVAALPTIKYLYGALC